MGKVSTQCLRNNTEVDKSVVIRFPYETCLGEGTDRMHIPARVGEGACTGKEVRVVVRGRGRVQVEWVGVALRALRMRVKVSMGFREGVRVRPRVNERMRLIARVVMGVRVGLR